MSTHEIATPNGAPPVDPLDRLASELEEQLAPLASRREQLEAELRDLSSRELRISEALIALRGKATHRGRPANPKKKDSHDWVPSQVTLDDVYATLAKATDPLTYRDIHEATGHSRASVQKAVDELRKQARVRFVGQGGQGGANQFTVMPSD